MKSQEDMRENQEASYFERDIHLELQLVSQQLTNLLTDLFCTQGFILPCLRTNLPVDTLTRVGSFISLKGRLELRPACRESQIGPKGYVEEFS